MFGFSQRSPLIKFLSSSILVGVLSWGLLGCSNTLEVSSPILEKSSVPVTTNKLSEVAPPSVIQELKEVLEQYHPQVTIVSPKPNQMLSETTLSVQLQVRDYPLFKDEKLGLGPHLHLFLDDQPYRAVYNVEEPIIIEDLSPGTHTIRVFASRPWHESFKNEGAYAQTTFHVFTETEDNAPTSSLPLLTYSRPQGSYGAEPIMLDFYLTNAPLHFVAKNDPDDDIVDWRIKATINGESFLIDTWQPIYLKGFEPGKNWVQLEFIDEQGNKVNNAFNDTVRVITYEPKGEDTLSKLVRGELSTEIARSIVDPNYINTLQPEATEEQISPQPPEVREEPIETSQETLTPETPQTVTEELETQEEAVQTSQETLTPETPQTVTEELETQEEAVQTSQETLTPETPQTVTEELETEEKVIEDEVDLVLDEVSHQEPLQTVKQEPLSPLSDILESEQITTTAENEDSSLSTRPQWLQNLLNSLPKIDLSNITNFFEGIKAKLTSL